jgi:hypothetical protein
MIADQFSAARVFRLVLPVVGQPTITVCPVSSPAASQPFLLAIVSAVLMPFQLPLVQTVIPLAKPAQVAAITNASPASTTSTCLPLLMLLVPFASATLGCTWRLPALPAPISVVLAPPT